MSGASSFPPTPASIHRAAAVGFGSAEGTSKYESARPSYPPAAIDRLIVRAVQRTCPPSRAHPSAQLLQVLDVGAGTGIFTRILRQRLTHYEQYVDPRVRFELTAVEPVEGMRRKFVEVTGSAIPVISGCGHELSGVASRSVSVIFAAQAFHWMASAATLAEFSRVLVPHGALCLVWNTRDRRTPWVHALESVVDDYYTPDVPRQQSGQWRRVFDAAGARWSALESEELQDGVLQTGDLQLMIDRVTSISVISSLSPSDKAQCEQRVRRAIVQHPDNLGKTVYTLPYVTETYWTHKLD